MALILPRRLYNHFLHRISIHYRWTAQIFGRADDDNGITPFLPGFALTGGLINNQSAASMREKCHTKRPESTQMPRASDSAERLCKDHE
jgi:hypothetical protein